MREIAHCTIKTLKRNKNGYQGPKTKENRDNLGQKSRRRDNSLDEMKDNVFAGLS